MTVLKIDELNWESDSDCLDHKNFKFPGDFFVKSLEFLLHLTCLGNRIFRVVLVKLIA